MSPTCVCGHVPSDEAASCPECGRLLAAAEAGDDALLGQEVLGTYRLTQLLGKGGMSMVYRARHLLTDQEVAVKVLPPDLAQHRELKARFIDEARTLARLEHPNIVLLHNFVEEQGHLYLIMQLAEGDTLEQVIAREGRVGVGDVVAVGVEVLRALEYAHDQQVIHRDIKPSNIIIRGDGAVKVMDFGIAKIVGSTKLTQTGQTMGTVRYMSPEQVRGKQVDHRTDLYSLGVTLYEAVTGRTPFDGDTHFEIMRKHLTDVARPARELAHIPAALDHVLTRSMEKRALARFESARAMRLALQHVPVDVTSRRITRSTSVGSVDSDKSRRAGSRSPRRNALPLLVAVGLLLLSAGAVVWALYEPSQRGVGPVPRRPAGGGGVRDARLSLGGGSARAWPAPHRVARELALPTDKVFAAEQLRVMAPAGVDAAKIAERYARAREAYSLYLRDEGLRVDLSVGPLNLALVPPSALNNPRHWPDADPGKDYPVRYQPPSATLYVQNAGRYLVSDLPYGFALHFCALTRLSNHRCMELAEGFERFLARAAP
ncbi:MAG: serine/threonine protein kinase [Deltaproteobacteria bacterium]|nr:serine/threonine protein kinase [Deltaproteobacteria bacterium]